MRFILIPWVFRKHSWERHQKVTRLTLAVYWQESLLGKAFICKGIVFQKWPRVSSSGNIHTFWKTRRMEQLPYSWWHRDVALRFTCLHNYVVTNSLVDEKRNAWGFKVLRVPVINWIQAFSKCKSLLHKKSCILTHICLYPNICRSITKV